MRQPSRNSSEVTDARRLNFPSISPVAQPGQPRPLLLRGAVGVDRIHDEARLHAREGAQPAVAALELLADQAVGDVVETCTAILLGEVRAEEAEFRQARYDAHGEGALSEVR